jgi:hypothetical protein
MSSNMTQIDEGFIQYPVPGIDNDSQGFRDRYSTIRTNLNTARTEIGDLITNTAKINTNNNFGGNKILNANLSSTTVEANIANDGDPINDNTLAISWQSGSVQVIRVGSSVTPLALTFTNWPTTTPNSDNRFAKITLIVNPPESGSRTIAWPAGIKKQQITPSLDSVSVISVGSIKLFEVFTYDAGTTLFVNYLGLYE